MRLSTYRIVIIILTISIVTTGLKAQLNLDSGLVAIYTFYGNAHDYSVNANHGIVNGVTLVDDRFGNVLSAYEFDGINDWIEITDTGVFDDINSISVSVWINAKSRRDHASVIYKGIEITGRNYFFRIATLDQPDVNITWGICSPDEELYDFIGSFSLNDWHMLTLIATENGSYKAYIDNQQIHERPITTFDIFEGNSIKIGRGDSFFEGMIDDILIYDRELSQAEIQALYLGSSTGIVFIYCSPNYAYQNHNFFSTIQGTNTHFSEGIKNIWLSKDDRTIIAERYSAVSNTQIETKFYIPPDASTGHWEINIESSNDSILTIPYGIEILPLPSVTPQNGSNSSWLRSICAINDMICWTVGNDGSIQKTVDGGMTWELQNSGISDVLYSTFFANEMAGWAVGQYGTILNTTNGGEEWSLQNSGTSNNLQSIFFINEQTGWAVGRSGTILKTMNGVINWESQVSGTTSWLYSVHFTNINNGWAVGSNGTILHTADGGNVWDSQFSGTTDYLSSIHFYDSDTAWVVGSRGTILKTVDGSENWIAKESNTTEWLRSVFFINSQTGWAVGTNGVLIATTDGGETWATGRSFTTRTLSSIHFADDLTGWVVGETGTILNLMMSNLATAIEDEPEVSYIPREFKLFQNYPNPFNPITAIGYRLLAVSDVELGIYNMLGQKVAVLVSERQSAGIYQVQWDASGYASGVYLYRIITDNGFSDTKKLLLLK